MLNLRRVSLLSMLVLAAALPAWAGVPDWLRALAREPVGNYPPSTNAIVLLDEQVTSVSADGQIKTVHRRAIRILRPNTAKQYAKVVVPSDQETALTFLKAWSIASSGEYEVKEKDAAVTNAVSDFLYEDTHYTVLEIPAVEAGSVVGYEYEQKQRPTILQDIWRFQVLDPIKHARYTLQLPSGWQFHSTWLHHDAVAPAGTADRWTWELSDVPAIADEAGMPDWRAVSGRMALTFVPAGHVNAHALQTWSEVGEWYSELAAAALRTSPEISDKVRKLTASASTTLEKVRALAAFTQAQVRYVAIEIGIGGFQPHAASSVLQNSFGDCKDKATLLSVMLREIGVESFLVAAHSARGAVDASFASPYEFNHMILAILATPGVDFPNATVTDEKLGRLVLFDPTSRYVDLGQLPSALQGGKVLLLNGADSKLVTAPVAPPEENQLRRDATLHVASDGSLVGSVTERYSGALASALRYRLGNRTSAEQKQLFESELAASVPHAALLSFSLENRDDPGRNLVARYEFRSSRYAQSAASLLIFRAGALSGFAGALLDDDAKQNGPRTLPLQFDATRLMSDMFEIELPEGYDIDELPAAVEWKAGGVSYFSRVESAPDRLTLKRQLRIGELRVDAADVNGLDVLKQKIATDEKSSVVLKASAVATP